MFSDREQAKFEHLQYIQRRLIAMKSKRYELVVIFLVFFGLAYWGAENIFIAITIGWIPIVVRASAYELKRTYLSTEFNRALCEFDGDLKELKLRLRIDAELGKI